MIESKIRVVGYVIGGRGHSNPTSSSQNHYLKRYWVGIVFFLLTFGLVVQAMGEDRATPVGPPATPGSASPDAPAPMTDIHDILPPIAVGMDAPWLIPVLLALAALAILAAAWWWWKKRKKDWTIETIVPDLPPEMIARRALEEIADVRRMDGKSFYFRLSAILRQYVYGRFAVGAPEMTTEEFLPCIDGLHLDNDLAQRLRRMCRAMDPVKFGGQMAVERQMETDLLFAREFVRKTTQPIDMDGRAKAGEQNHEKSKKQIPNLN